jgi:uncharacterized DUF497 family protein
LNTHLARAYEWDPDKRERTLAAREIDFVDAVRIFDGPTLERVDTRQAHPEVRVLAIGLAHARHLTVVYTDRPQRAGHIVRRIISARRSNRHERQAYADAILPR